MIGNYFGGKYKHKAELVGGIILVLLGVRIFDPASVWISIK